MTEQGATRRLSAGRHELLAPLHVSGEHLELIGTHEAGRITTWLARGVRPDGSLYDGPLIQVDHASQVRIRHIGIDGGRFSGERNNPRDARHPLTADRRSPQFPCARVLPEPDCYDRGAFASSCEADVLIRDASDVELLGLVVRNSIRIGVAVGARSSRVLLRQCEVARAGDYGIWVGAGLEPEDRRLPLDPAFEAILPQWIRIEDSQIERCGSAGVYLEGRDLHLERTRLVSNCYDAPYDDEGGQLTIDYKTRGLTVRDCAIVAGGEVVRSGPGGGENLLGAFGVEACGEDLHFEDTLIEGNAREGVQILGGRGIRFSGRTRIVNNHLAQHRHPGFPGHRQRQNLSITTTSPYAAVNAIADDIELDGVTCENGLMVWSDGSLPDLVLDRLRVVDCDLTGPDHEGVVAGDNHRGGSLRGPRWRISDEGL